MAKNTETKVTFRAFNKEFNQAIKEMQNESSKLRKEFLLQQEELKQTGTESEKLSSKLMYLQKSHELAGKKVDETRAQLERVKAQFGENSTEAQRMENKLLDAQIAYQKLGNQVKEASDDCKQLENAQKQLSNLFAATDSDVTDFANTLGQDLVNAIKEGTASSKQLETAFGKVAQEALGTSADLDKIKNTLKTLDDGNSIENIKRDLKELSKAANEAEQDVDSFGDTLNNAVAGIAAGGGIAAAISTALDTSSLNTTIEISMEVPEASQKSVKEAINAVSSYGVDAESALEGVRRQWALNKDASDETNTAVVKGAATIARAYSQIDFTELIQETNEIAREMKISNEEALGLTNALLKIGFPPEQLDIISEYGAQLQRAGYDAEEIQAIMAAGVETGTWNIDNLLDGLKEGRIRVSEFGDEVPKALEGLIEGTNISAKQMKEWGKAVSQGGKKGSQAMTEIAKALNGVEDETKKNLIGVQVFGTMYEDQGQNIIDTLLNAKGATVDLKKSQDELNDATTKLNADPAVAMKQAVSDLKLALEPLLTTIANVIAKVAEWGSENPKLMSSILAIGSAVGVLAGAIAFLAPVFISITGAIAGAGGAAAVFGTALGVLIGPIGLTVAALAGLGIGAVAVANKLKKPSIEADIFGDKVSEATQKAVGGFLELDEQATISLNHLSWSGKTVTQDMATSITETFNKMGDQVLTTMQEDHVAQLQTMQDFFTNSKALTDAEETQIIADMQLKQGEKEAVISNGKARIAEILTTAKNNNRGITEAEQLEINKIQETMKLNAVKYMSESELEQKVILERLKTESSSITALQAAEVVANSKKQKDEVVKEATDQYNKTVAEIIKQRDETGVISAEQAQKLIGEAKRQRDETVKNAEDAHKNVVKEAKAQSKEHINEVNWETGEILSKWEVFKGDLGRKIGGIKTNAIKKWQEMKTDTINKFQEMKTDALNKIEELKTSAGTKFSEAKKKITEPIEEAKETVDKTIKKIKGFFDNLKLKFPKIEMPKLPKFSLEGKFSLMPPSVPKLSVSWNALGGVFKRPTIFNTANAGLQGVGEAGAEAILPLKDPILAKIGQQIADTMNYRQSEPSIIVQFYGDNHFGNDMDIDYVGTEIANQTIQKLRAKGVR